MTKVTLLFAGFLVAFAIAHPAAEDDLHLHEEKEHRKTPVNVGNARERQGEVAREKETEVHEQINIGKNVFLHPTIKCAEIVPDVGQPGPENHQACLAHCVQLEEYRQGRCLKGICHCGIEETDKPLQRNEKGHATVRCEHINPTPGTAGPVNHEACRAHCSSLGHELSRGECVEGICRCGVVETVSVPHSPVRAAEHVDAVLQSQVQNSAESARAHPTVKCEHLVPLKGALSAENHELCFSHCRSLGSEYFHGECVQGVCHCQREHAIADKSREETYEGYPTVRCEHIHPITGRPGPENHEACSFHCHSIADLYVGGRCVVGVCTCKPGTVVKAVTTAVHSRRSI